MSNTCKTCGAFVDGTCDATWVANDEGKHGPVQIDDYEAEKDCWRNESEHMNWGALHSRKYRELEAELATLKEEMKGLKEEYERQERQLGLYKRAFEELDEEKEE